MLLLSIQIIISWGWGIVKYCVAGIWGKIAGTDSFGGKKPPKAGGFSKEYIVGALSAQCADVVSPWENNRAADSRPYADGATE